MPHRTDQITTIAVEGDAKICAISALVGATGDPGVQAQLDAAFEKIVGREVRPPTLVGLMLAVRDVGCAPTTCVLFESARCWLCTQRGLFASQLIHLVNGTAKFVYKLAHLKPSNKQVRPTPGTLSVQQRKAPMSVLCVARRMPTAASIACRWRSSPGLVCFSFHSSSQTSSTKSSSIMVRCAPVGLVCACGTVC
jgi:hypothetical protein